MVTKIQKAVMHGTPLSRGEFLAAYLYAHGLSAKKVAYRLKISNTAARERIKRVYAKLGINDRLELLQYMIEEGT